MSAARHGRAFRARPARLARAGAAEPAPEQRPDAARPQPGPDGAPAAGAGAAAPLDIDLPKTGYLSLADPNAEVYSKAGERFDPAKKGGRWKPEFIWQTNWQEQLKRQEDLERQQRDFRARQAAGGVTGGTGPGVVSFARLGALDDITTDLSAQLRAAKEKRAREAAAAAAAAAATAAAAGGDGRPQQAAVPQAAAPQAAAPQARARRGAGSSPSYQYKDLPTKNEARRFQRATRAVSSGKLASTTAVGGMAPEEAAARAAAAAVAAARYEQLKLEFQAWAIGLGALGTALCYVSYSRDTAISYALGASAGLTYLRLLSRTIDSVGDGGAANAAIGQPRLLIPVVLALSYNRWNALYAESAGYYLELLPMMIGFLTYKVAVLGRQGLELLSDLSEPARAARGEQAGAAEGGGGGGGDEDGGGAQSLDRIFLSSSRE
ncbi:CGL160 [Scenedesmus sp. PABB004]|nr:CGL160 [Scenedesmus sp. PABB004]